MYLQLRGPRLVRMLHYKFSHLVRLFLTKPSIPAMASLKSFLSILILLAFAYASNAASRPIIEMSSEKTRFRSDDENDLVCKSWKFSFEANNLRELVPVKCVPFVEEYVKSRYFERDLLYAAESAYDFAKTVKLSSDGKDAWILGVDDTLLSTLPYYEKHGYGSESFNETEYNEWVAKADAPANPGGFLLYNWLQNLGFKIILLTGRDEFARAATEQNLRLIGLSDWDKLIMRQSFDQGQDAIVYKSGRRALLELEGYRLHGNIGDQWSDLLGIPTATRSFKFPNPLYYVP